MNKLITLSLLCTVLMSVSARAQTQDTNATITDSIRYGRIKGIVTSEDKTEPLPGVVVIPQGFGDTVSTNIDGLFEIKNIVPGNYRLKIYLPDFYTILSDVIYVKGNKETHVAVKLRGMPSSLNVTIDHQPMVTGQTGSVRIWTEDEIKRNPGH